MAPSASCLGSMLRRSFIFLSSSSFVQKPLATRAFKRAWIGLERLPPCGTVLPPKSRWLLYLLMTPNRYAAFDRISFPLSFTASQYSMSTSLIWSGESSPKERRSLLSICSGSSTPGGKFNDFRSNMELASNEFTLDFKSVEPDASIDGWFFLGMRTGEKAALPGDACGGSGCEVSFRSGCGAAS